MSFHVKKEVEGLPDYYEITLNFKDGTRKKIKALKHQQGTALLAEIVPVKIQEKNKETGKVEEKIVRQFTKWHEAITGDLEIKSKTGHWYSYRKDDIKSMELCEKFTIIQEKKPA